MSIAELTGIDVPTGLLIGGEWGKGAATFPVFDPATEEPLAEVADGTVSDGARRGERRAGGAARLGGDAAAAAGGDAAQGVRADDGAQSSSSPG